MQEIGAETGIKYDRATRGVLKIYRSTESLDGAAAVDRLSWRSTGCSMSASTPSARSSSNRRLKRPSRRWPVRFISPATRSATATNSRKAWPRLARRAAFRFRYGETVQSIETSGGRVTGVVTDKGRIAADTVVVAMGSFTAPLLAKLGIRVPIYPVKGLSITFPRGAWNSAPQMPVIDDSKLFGLVPIGDRMRISGSAEIAGYDTTPAPSRAQAIVENAGFTFPEMKRHLDMSKARIWAGLRPVSPAGTPIIGRTPDRRPLGQCRSRASRLDAGLRLGPGRCRSDCRTQTGDQSSRTARRGFTHGGMRPLICNIQAKWRTSA